MHELLFQACVKGMSERSELIPCNILIFNYGTIQTMHTDKLGVAWGRGYGCGVKLNFGTKILSPT